MPNKCNIVECRGNYDGTSKCRVFRLPRDEVERQRWINMIPPRENFVINPANFFICERHWPVDTPMVKIPGGSTRPACPPSIFTNVPPSCLPTAKPAPRPPKPEDQQLKYFKKKDKITSFAEFLPEKQLHKKYENLMLSRSEERFICVFMARDYSESKLSIIVHNKSTLCSPLTLQAFKDGISVPFGNILNPNNGLSSYSQYFEAINFVINYDINAGHGIEKAVKILQSQQLETGNAKKLKFLTRQLQLLSHKNFSVADYCFGIESFPTCNYDNLREFLVLPSKRKLQSIISGTNRGSILDKTFKKTYEQQKNAFLLIDEVKIRPMIAYSGGILNGIAKNDPNSKATSMLCVMMKCLHGGPSLMISITPVHKLTSSYQFEIVKEAATTVENSGGVVLGSITDNHKINQQFCKMFDRVHDFQAIHPLDSQRAWYLLYDTVHILKCIRNNWLTEKCQKLSLDNQTVGSFSDVRELYKEEKNNILKTTPLTQTAVNPSRLQLQNVQHVLRVFNDKVVAALRLKGASETANFIQQVLDWWNIVNVSAKGQDVRIGDTNRAVQDKNSTNLKSFLDKLQAASSGYGQKRFQCLTHDTKRALMQTTQGLLAVSAHLLANGYRYVLLREIQSDRIEGEFSVYRQSTGANAFMGVSDVVAAFRKRLARFAASFLETIEVEPSNEGHVCEGPINEEDASSIEKCVTAVSLSASEESAVAYVAGWLEKKVGKQLVFSDDEPQLTGDVKNFIEEVSRGNLTVPHACTYEMVRIGLSFTKYAKHRACCRQRLVNILSIMDTYYDLGLSSAEVSGGKDFCLNLIISIRNE